MVFPCALNSFYPFRCFCRFQILNHCCFALSQTHQMKQFMFKSSIIKKLKIVSHFVENLP